MCFQHAQTVAVYAAEMIRTLADSLLLPLNATKYADTLIQYVNDLDTGYGNLMRNENVTLGLYYFLK